MRKEPVAKRLRVALERFVVAVEVEDELLANSERVWTAYEKARAVLGDPVKEYPGGYEDAHTHLFGWQESDGCDTCADWQADQSAEAIGGEE